MSTDTADRAKQSNAYELFIFMLTVLSLGIMVVLLLPLSDATIQLLTVYDNAICVVFLIDFTRRLRHHRSAHTSSENAAGSTCWARSASGLPVRRVAPAGSFVVSRGSLGSCVARRGASWSMMSSLTADSTPRSFRSWRR